MRAPVVGPWVTSTRRDVEPGDGGRTSFGANAWLRMDPGRKRLGSRRPAMQASWSGSALTRTPGLSSAWGPPSVGAEAPSVACPSGAAHLVGRSPLGDRFRASLPVPGASAWFGGGSRPGSGSGRERPDILLSEACRLRAEARAPSPHPARPGSGSPSERERSEFDPGLGCSGAPVAQAPRELPGGHRVPEANLGSVWRPYRGSVGTGAAVAPAVSAGSLGEPGSLHDIRAVRPDLRTGGSEPRGVRVHPPDAVRRRGRSDPKALADRPPVAAVLLGAPDREAWAPETRSAAGRNPPEAGREVREILRSSAPASRRLETVPRATRCTCGETAEFTPRPPATDGFHRRLLPDGSGSFRRLLRTCAGSAPSLGAWWFGGPEAARAVRVEHFRRPLLEGGDRGPNPPRRGSFRAWREDAGRSRLLLARAFRPKPSGSHTRSRP